MKNLLVLLLFASSLFLRAQSLFDGTWEMKMDTLQFSGSPEDYLFADGEYTNNPFSPTKQASLGMTSEQSVTGKKSQNKAPGLHVMGPMKSFTVPTPR